MKRLQKYLSVLLALLCCAGIGSCTDDDTTGNDFFVQTDAEYYSANARGLTYNGDEVVIRITSNTYWIILNDQENETSEPWFTLDRKAGNGNTDLAVKLQRNPGNARSATLKIATNRNASTTVTLSQAGAGEVVYFYGDDFGTGGGGTPVQEFDGWNLHGMGVEALYYDAQSANVGSDSPSSGYDGASGGNNVLLGGDGWLSLGGIATRGDYNFIFSFGVCNDRKAPSAEELRLFISQDRMQWTPVDYTMPSSASEAGKWSMVRIPFFVKENCPALFFRFESSSPGYRIDDPALEEGDATGETIVFLEDVVTYIRTVLWEDDFSWANNSAYVKSDDWTGADGTRIDRWTNYPTSTNGWTIESGRATSYPRAKGSASETGFLKNGWGNGGAGLFTPPFEAIGDEARDVLVELTLACWTHNNKPDNDRLCIRVVGGGTIGNAADTEQLFNIGSWNEWTLHEFEIFGATAATQIYIGSTIEANNRWFIDRFRLIHVSEKPDDFKPELTVDPGTLEFVTAGESHAVNLTANAAWKVRSEADWLSFSPQSGDAGSTTLFIEATANISGAERLATVEFTIEDEVIATLDAVQQARQIEYAPSPVNLRLVDASPTALTFAWDEPADASYSYRTALFADPAGDPIRLSPEFPLQTKYPAPVFTFGGLDPATVYHLAVRTVSATDGVEDSPYVLLESRTTAPQADVQDALATMRFDRLKWCGDHMLQAYGLRPTTVNKDTTPDAAPDALTNPNTGGSADIFNTHGANLPAFTADRQLSDWYGLRAYEYPGYIKLGTSTQAGFLVTPPMSGLSEPSSVRISFRLGNWNEPNADGSACTPDKAVVRVGVVPQEVTNDNLKSYANAYTLLQNISFTADEAPVDATALTWSDVTFEIPDVKPTDRLIIYATVDGQEVKGKARYELDDIVVVRSDTPQVTTVFEDSFEWVSHTNDWVSKQAGFTEQGWIAGTNDTATGHDWRRVYAKDQCIQFGTGSAEGAITTPAFTQLDASVHDIAVEAQLTGNADNKRSVCFEIIGSGSFSATEQQTTYTVRLDGFMPNPNTASGKDFDGWETRTLTVYGADRTTQIRLACVKVDGVTQQFWLNHFRVTR